MTLIESRPLMTTRELLAMPDDGIERELSQGILKERKSGEGGDMHEQAVRSLNC